MKIKDFRISIKWVLMFIIPLLILSTSIFSQDIFSFLPEDPIPFDQQITKGEFGNGLTYYIRQNKKPENRAQFWLIVNAGSILEDEDQLGLAHFTEHMAFNGTKNFAKHEIVDYLETIGMQFGPEVNAYTGFDETVYMLEVPTDSTGFIETAFSILEDWARYISFENEEIEKERGVVIEEWRLGRGAEGRMQDKQLPVLFKDSRYASRLPIGEKKVLETFGVETIKRYYNDWYRPDQMAIIAVGDFDRIYIENLIRKHFEEIPMASNPRKREYYRVPAHNETLFAIATDPEATNTRVVVYYKRDPESETTINDYRRMLIEQLNVRMMNNRLYELLNQPDPPFLFGITNSANIVRTKDVYLAGALVKEDGIYRGLETLLTESERVRKYGFTQTELERTKNKLIRELETAYNEQDKTESQSFAAEYSRNFLENEPVPGIEFEYKVSRELLPGISLDEVNRLIEKWMGDKERVVFINAPEKEEMIIPSEEQLLTLLDNMEDIDVEPYKDMVSEKPLVEKIPKPGQILKEKQIKELNVTEWTLSNGCKIVLKPTDFQNDEVLFYAFSPGGTSLISDKDYISGKSAADIISLGGAGEFELNELNKKIADKVVTVFPYINDLTEGLIGNSTPKDMETMFQLIYLYITSPRKDSSAFLSFQTRMKGFIQNRSADPESAYYDTIMVTLAQYHPRVKPWSEELLNELDLESVYDFYKNRFEDAGDFTFIFVGNFTVEGIKPLITSYLGQLPSGNRKELWKDPGIYPPEGIIKKNIRRGIEPKGRVSLNFTGQANWSRKNNYALNSLENILDIKLREVLREDKSGTYGVSVTSSLSKYPKQEYKVNISFGCDPNRIDELIPAVFHVIDSLQTYGADETVIKKVRETQLRSYEKNLKENDFWLRNLQHYLFTGQNPKLIMKYPDLVATINSKLIKKAANIYLNNENIVQVVLLPEEFTYDKPVE